MTPEPMPTMDEDISDEYHDELIADRRRRRGEGWRNPKPEEEEEDEEIQE